MNIVALIAARAAELQVGATFTPRSQSVSYGSAGSSADIEAMLRGAAPMAVGNPEQAMKVPAVYRCITLISGAVATMPIALKRRVGETRVDASDHPLWPILRKRPNRWQTPSQFRRQLQTHLLLRGNAYAMKARVGSGAGQRIAGLIPLMPDRLQVHQLDDWTLEYDYTTRRGERIRLAQADVMHLVGHTLDGVNGLSPIGCARETIGLAMEMQRHASRTFANGARISGTLSHPGELGAKAQLRLSENLESYRSGGERDGKALILEEGMKYERMGLSMADAQFVEGSVANRSEIYMYFGVPPHMAGDVQKTTSWGSGIDSQAQGFVAYTLEDWLTTWEETIARDLIADSEPDLFVRFNRAALVRGDIKTRYAAYSVARQWGLQTIDEIRALEEMGPLANGAGEDPFAGGNAQRPPAADPFAPDPADAPPPKDNADA